MTRAISLATALIVCGAMTAAAQTDVGEIRLVVTGATGAFDAPLVATGTLASEARPSSRYIRPSLSSISGPRCNPWMAAISFSTAARSPRGVRS